MQPKVPLIKINSLSYNSVRHFSINMDDLEDRFSSFSKEEQESKMKSELGDYLQTIEDFGHFDSEHVPTPEELQEKLEVFEHSGSYTPKQLYELLISVTMSLSE